jgi:hypothetical protein
VPHEEGPTQQLTPPADVVDESGWTSTSSSSRRRPRLQRRLRRSQPAGCGTRSR